MAQNDDEEWPGKYYGNDRIILMVVEETKPYKNRYYKKEGHLPIGAGNYILYGL